MSIRNITYIAGAVLAVLFIAACHYHGGPVG